jgi:hypothetical protein
MAIKITDLNRSFGVGKKKKSCFARFLYEGGSRHNLRIIGAIGVWQDNSAEISIGSIKARIWQNISIG